jgi:hypothetical protein
VRGEVLRSGFRAKPCAWAIPAARCQTEFDSFGSHAAGSVEYAALGLRHTGSLPSDRSELRIPKVVEPGD